MSTLFKGKKKKGILEKSKNKKNNAKDITQVSIHVLMPLNKMHNETFKTF